ncbi:hypothetical protein MPSEU_000649500 [Mayamaea pseudoterrestris]|nr:hypothetical protein MPSEU_000649500 [Mayamaea pseudoterrestris]
MHYHSRIYTHYLQKMLFLSESNVRQCLNMSDCLAINRVALQSIFTKQSTVPTRLALAYEPADKHDDDVPDWTLVKAASFTQQADEVNDADHHHPSSSSTTQMGVKVVSVRSHNPDHGLPLVPASLLNIDPATGIVDAVLAATYLTAARTAAGSALATSIMQPNLQHLVVFGAGLQAELHVHAIATALGYSIPKLTIVNRSERRAQELAQKLPADWVQHTHVVLLNDSLSVADALSTADCVVTSTNAATPVLDGTTLLKPGCHVNGIGSYTPHMQEVAARTVDRCRVLIDTHEARTVGDLKHLTEHHPVMLLGELLLNPDLKNKWKSDEQTSPMIDCTFYKSVGTCIQDIMTASVVVKRARELGIGMEVDMS